MADKIRKIGVRIPVAKPGSHYILGHNAAVYDVETGDLFLASRISLYITTENVVSATIEVDVSEVVIGDGNARS